MSCVLPQPMTEVFEKTFADSLSGDVFTSTVVAEMDSHGLIIDFGSEEEGFGTIESQQTNPVEDPQLGGAAAGPVDDAILAACRVRWSGEALWEQVEAALLNMSNGSPEISEGNSIVIFDWDDTLFPTTSLHMSGNLLSPSEHASVDLAPCALAACEALRTAKRHGKVVIVTNAISGWVHEMIARFMPLVEPELEDVPIVSARSIYEPQGIADTSQWKPLCFQRVVRCLASKLGACGIKNLVSIGDSWYERAAVFQAATESGIPCQVKSLKFLTQPGIQDIARQLSFCTFIFSWLMNYEGPLDLWLDPSGNVQVVTEAVLSGLSSETFGSMGPFSRDPSWAR